MMKKSPKVIKLDIDNTIRDMAEVMLGLYNNKFHTSLTKDDIIDYDLDVSFPLLKESGINAFKFFFEDNANYFSLAPTLPGAVEGVRKLREKGYSIHIVTFQPSYEAKLLTLNWLDNHRFEYDNLTFTNSPSKKGIPCTYAIDDRMEYLDDAVADGGIPVCISWKYNTKYSEGIRVSSVENFANIISDEVDNLLGELC